jgi:hypothetical protein
MKLFGICGTNKKRCVQGVDRRGLLNRIVEENP